MDHNKTLFQGKFLSLVKNGRWEYVTRNNASGVVIVVPVTGDDELVLVEQFRPAVDRTVIEFPAGLAGDLAGQADEALSVAAARELREETGFVAGEMKQVYRGPSSAGLTDEITTIFIAKELTKTGTGGGVGGEEITVHTVPNADIFFWLQQQEKAGKYVAARVYAGLYLLDKLQVED